MRTFRLSCKRRKQSHNQPILREEKKQKRGENRDAQKKFLAASAAGGVLAASAKAFEQAGMSGSVKTGYAPVNGLRLYYEFHGTGEPLILLHGGLGSIEMFAELVPGLRRRGR